MIFCQEFTWEFNPESGAFGVRVWRAQNAARRRALWALRAQRWISRLSFGFTHVCVREPTANPDN